MTQSPKPPAPVKDALAEAKALRRAEIAAAKREACDAPVYRGGWK